MLTSIKHDQKMNPNYAVVLFLLHSSTTYYCTKFFADMKHSTVIHNLKVLGLIKSKKRCCRLTKLGKAYEKYLFPYDTNIKHSRLDHLSLWKTYYNWGLSTTLFTASFTLVPPIHLSDIIVFAIFGLFAPFVEVSIVSEPDEQTVSGLQPYNYGYCKQLLRKYPRFTKKHFLYFLVNSGVYSTHYKNCKLIIDHQMFSVNND